jgi:two-component system cell cycle response regulator DivK
MALDPSPRHGDTTVPPPPVNADCDHEHERPLVLLVDDFEDALAIYALYLDQCGYRVVIARNGDEAVKAARVHRPRLILLDLRMPVMSGTEALRILRDDPSFGEVPIVALTAHALEGERAQALAAGFDRVISKPCLPDELVAVVRDYLPAQAAAS